MEVTVKRFFPECLAREVTWICIHGLQLVLEALPGENKRAKLVSLPHRVTPCESGLREDAFCAFAEVDAKNFAVQLRVASFAAWQARFECLVELTLCATKSVGPSAHEQREQKHFLIF
jgi:hypothetical protein